MPATFKNKAKYSTSSLFMLNTVLGVIASETQQDKKWNVQMSEGERKSDEMFIYMENTKESTKTTFKTSKSV